MAIEHESGTRRAERRAAQKRAPRTKAPRNTPRRRLSVIGVIGELFITAGVLVMLFLGWQIWLGNLIEGNEQKDEAVALAQTWAKGESTAPASVDRPDPGDPVIAATPEHAAQFANMIIPRFGADYVRPVLEGVGTDDVLRYGIGHYPGTQMPGDIGNAAFAAHRTGHGSPFYDIDKLQVGDSVYIEMEAGWYQYKVRSLEYVLPTGVDVLAAVPQAPEVAGTDRLLTLTSCNPVHTADERFIVYAVFETWFPRAAGAPPELATAAAAGVS